MLDPNWVLLSVALGLVGASRYALLTLQGRLRPNLVTWSLWAAAPLIAFFAQLDAGVGMPALQTLASGVAPLIVFVTGLLTRHGRVRVTGFDLWCGFFALIALLVWVILGQAVYAVFIAILADAVAGFPTFRKVWHDPHTEGVSMFMLVAIGATVTLLTVAVWTPETWAFAAYSVVIAISLVAFNLIRRAVLGRSTETSEHSVRPLPGEQ